MRCLPFLIAHAGVSNFAKAYAMQHFCTLAVHYRKCNVRPVLRRIDMYPKRSFANGASTTLTIASRYRARTGGTMAAKASCIFFP